MSLEEWVGCLRVTSYVRLSGVQDWGLVGPPYTTEKEIRSKLKALQLNFRLQAADNWKA